MPKIHILPQSVISKIAAGEVIERPVYAVKELIENSLDAKADSIKVIIEEGGLKRITVIDNGVGMSKEDLEISFKPHATSKLQNEEELSHIETLGFRGEALSSIAAISTMTINSRMETSHFGNSIKIKDGVASETIPVGIPVGTQVIVENLFHSIPARKKFLKSQRTEFRHMIDVLTHFAISHNEVQFILIHNGKTILDLPKTENVLERIQALLGNDIYEHILPINFDDSYISLSGFVTKPQVTTKTPHKHFLFVNKRKIHDRTISQTIKSSFGTLLEKDAYPICILFFSIPHQIVDVNVHPKKDEVRFMNTKDILKTVTQAISQTLSKHDISFHSHSWKQAIFIEDNNAIYNDKSTTTFAAKLLKENLLPWEIQHKIKTDIASVMQLHNLYLVTSSQKGLAIIDQHAAHERILYEQFVEEFSKQKKISKTHIFAKPKIIELDKSESALLEEHLDTFSEYGFMIEHFKGNSFLVRSIPELFQDRDPTLYISEVLKNLRMELQVFDIDSFSQKMLAYLACRKAVKAGDALTKTQCHDLLVQLEKTANNATCPHGRPTKVLIYGEMLQKMFKR